MTPKALDEYLKGFGDNVNMRSKSSGKMIPVDKLRMYIQQAIQIAVEESKVVDKRVCPCGKRRDRTRGDK